MHIAILSPSDRSFISKFLPNIDADILPEGYFGAPFIGTIIEELLSLNHRVTAITTTKAKNEDYEVKKYNNGNFTWIVVPSRPHSIRNNGRKMGRIVDFYSLERKSIVKSIKEICPDIVHAHWSYEFAGAAIKSGFPYLVTIHDNAFQVFRYFKNGYRFGRLLMSEQILKKVKFASTVSPYMLAYAQKRCRSVKIVPNPTVISAGISNVELLINEKLESLSAPRILMINNGWDARKNGLSGLQAFAQLHKIMPNATLHLLGNGTEINGLAFKDVQNIGLKNVVFNGAVSHKKLIEEIKLAHLLLHPSLEESFGVVLIEAMSFGLPAIGGNDSGAVPWVLNDARLLVDVSKPTQIKDRLSEILNDKTLYKEIAIKGYQNVVTRFSSEKVVKEFLDYYENIIANWK